MKTRNGVARGSIEFKVLLVLILCLLTLTWHFSAASGSATQSTSHKAVRPKVPAAVPKEQVMPFHVGETLNYRVSWAAFSNAASLQTTIPERRDLFGWHTWHFRAVAHTQGTVRNLFEIDDEFDSYTDAMSLESRQFETYLNELGKITNRSQHLVATGQTPRAPGPAIMVAPGTRDPLGALYALRALDWQHTPEFRVPVFDGHDVYEMRASREAANETVKVAAGTFSTERIAVHVFRYQKEVTSIRLTMWVAGDPARTPVVMEADLPFGTLRAELISLQ
jgi:Protein of unknown function (DUF3108)